MNPRLLLEKFPIFGKMFNISSSGTPNQRAKVAAYCSFEVVGTQRPRAPEPESASSAVLNDNVGNGVPLLVFKP